MKGREKTNIEMSFLIAIVSGILLVTFNREVTEFTRSIREKPFESFVVLLLILIVSLLLRLTRNIEKATGK